MARVYGAAVRGDEGAKLIPGRSLRRLKCRQRLNGLGAPPPPRAAIPWKNDRLDSSMQRFVLLVALVLFLACRFSAAAAIELSVDAPPSLAAAAARIRGVDAADLRDALLRAGLELPPSVDVTLVPEDDPRAREAPPWVVGRAFGSRHIVIFPARVARYPYDSLESVLRHEVVHLALDARAAGQPLPRWFHEGVATSVEAGWDVTDQLRLLIAALRDPKISDVSQLFQSDAQGDTILAYLLATVLVEDLRQRYGGASPGRIAAQVARGVPFARALEMETGETPDTAAAHAWRAYLQWTNWIPAFTSGAAVWTGILALACVVFVVRRRRRTRRRQTWGDEETDGSETTT